MKKTVLTIALLLGSSSAFATDHATAVRIASRYVDLPDYTRTMSAKASADNDNRDYYIFNDRVNGNGFVVISGKDDANPVLGYSDTGFIDENNIPAPLQYFLARLGGAGSNAVATSRTSEAQVIVSPLVKTQWYQPAPYNALCPGDGTLLTGCVATAMAQVMNYHKWPERGHGTISYTSFTPTGGPGSAPVGELSHDLSTSVYDWDNMLPTYKDDQWNDKQVRAVSTLIRDCGYAAHMQYGAFVSDSYEHDAATALTQNFGYDARIYPHFGDYDTGNWTDLMKREFDNGFPVIVIGQGKPFGGNGHCFIADGYDSSGFVHINWGWNGDADGYYDISRLTPLHGGSPLNYSYMQSFISVHPRHSDSEAIYNPWLSMLWTLGINDLDRSGLTVENEGEVLDADNYGKIRVDGLAYISSYPAAGQFRLVLTDKAGNALKTVAATDFDYKGLNSATDGQMIDIAPVPIGAEDFDGIVDGSYRLVPFTSIGGMESQKVQCYGYKGHVNVEISDGKVRLTNVAKPSTSLKVSEMISIAPEVPMFSTVSGQIKITNSGEFRDGGTLTVYAVPTNGSASIPLWMENMAVYEHQSLSIPMEFSVVPRERSGKKFSAEKEYSLMIEMTGSDGNPVELVNDFEMPHFKVVYDMDYLPETTITSVKVTDLYHNELDIDNLELDVNEAYYFDYTYETKAKDVAPEVFDIEFGLDESSFDFESSESAETTGKRSFCVMFDLYKPVLKLGEQHLYFSHSDFLTSEEPVFAQPESLSRLKVKLYDSMSGIDDIVNDTIKETGRYNLQGIKVPENAKGVIIIHHSDGSRRKTLVK